MSKLNHQSTPINKQQQTKNRSLFIFNSVSKQAQIHKGKTKSSSQQQKKNKTDIKT